MGDAILHKSGGSQLGSSLTDGPLRPVVVRQLLDATQEYSGAPFEIEGHEVSYVTIVATVIYLYGRSPRKLVLEDGSRGRITAEHYNDEDRIEKLTYVRVIGKLKSFQGCNSLLVYSQRRVQDVHEIYYHLLDAMVTKLVYERGPPPLGMEPNISKEELPGHGIPPSSAYKTECVDDLSGTFSASMTMSESANSAIISPSSLPPRAARPHKCLHEEDSSNLDAYDIKGKGRDFGYCEESRVCEIPPRRHRQVPTSTPSPAGPSRARPSILTSSTIDNDRMLSPPHRYASLPTNSDAVSLDNQSWNADDDTLPSPSLGGGRSIAHAQAKLRHDPYSSLSHLQRTIYLCIRRDDQPPSLYPNLHGDVTDDFEGVHVRTLGQQISIMMPSVDAEQVDNAIQYLIDAEYIHAPADDLHLRITGLK